MTLLTEIFVLSGVRTAIADYGSALKDFAPSELGAQVMKKRLNALVLPQKTSTTVCLVMCCILKLAICMCLVCHALTVV